MHTIFCYFLTAYQGTHCFALSFMISYHIRISVTVIHIMSATFYKHQESTQEILSDIIHFKVKKNKNKVISPGPASVMAKSKVSLFKFTAKTHTVVMISSRDKSWS